MAASIGGAGGGIGVGPEHRPDEAAGGAGAEDAGVAALDQRRPVTVRRGEPLRLRANVDVGEIDLAFAAPDGEWTALVEDGDASILSTRTAGGFVGSVFGAYAYSPAGPAD